MTENKIIKLINEEIKNPNHGVTEQFLEVHNLVFNNKVLQIERIDWNLSDNLIAVYMPVENEKFFYFTIIEKNTKKVGGISSIPHHKVYLHSTSKELSVTELKSFTKLVPTRSWDKNDFRPSGKSKFGFSAISFLPNPEPDFFENKLNKLLNYLESDKEGITNLVDNSDSYISVVSYYHNYNEMPGGPTIDKQAIQRIGKLNLEISFDQYMVGNKIKE